MDRAKLKERIREVAQNVKHVRVDELFNLLDNHVESSCQARAVKYDHRNNGGSHHAFTVGSQTFTVAKPHGTSLLKAVYVRKFLDAMEFLGLYEEE